MTKVEYYTFKAKIEHALIVNDHDDVLDAIEDAEAWVERLYEERNKLKTINQSMGSTLVDIALAMEAHKKIVKMNA